VFRQESVAFGQQYGRHDVSKLIRAIGLPVNGRQNYLWKSKQCYYAVELHFSITGAGFN
jgi:hypothetical protein